jgi:Tol biopolymer transport system component/DNA-binding winged helix-turn-helix (wHTH) protein
MSQAIEDTRNLSRKLRFDAYEVDPRSGELRKYGVRFPLEDLPFRALLILLRHPNEVVKREELQKQLWSSDVFIDFDHGLNTVIRKIRLALNDRAAQPRFIETVGRRGYRFLGAVEQDPAIAPGPRGSEEWPGVTAVATEEKAAAEGSAAVGGNLPAFKSKKVYFLRRSAALAVTTLAAVLLLAYVFRPAMPTLRIERAVQLTKAGGVWYLEPLYTDGPRVYYQAVGSGPADWQIREVLLNGNEDTPAGIPRGFRIRGLSPDDTEFVATYRQEQQWTVWTLPVASGSPRRIGNLMADDIAWSHHGSMFAYSQGNQLFLAQSDGASPRLLATLADASAAIGYIRWSPDDGRLRFTLMATTTQSLWEIGVDGRDLHELRFHWAGQAMECCGDWTRDGHYFLFKSDRGGISNLWVLEEKADWWRRANREPAQLTSGPISYYQPIFSRNGNQIFAIGVQPSGELVRYDVARKEFTPFLGGPSVDRVEYSRDRQWMAYVAYPERTLWRARSDGSEPLQLTFSPLRVAGLRWSADGKRIAFHASALGEPWKCFTISAEGGNPEPFPAETLSQTNPDWMPGRDALIYGRAYYEDNPALYVFDLRSGRSDKIPGSDGLAGPAWSPDGNYLSAIDMARSRLVLVDPQSGKRTDIGPSASWPNWSSDSQYVYVWQQEAGWISRVHVPDGKAEKIVAIPFRSATGSFTLGPDNSPIMLREHGRYDVYALSLSRDR